LVAELGVGERVAVLIPGGQHHRQQIPVVDPVVPVGVNDPVGEGVRCGQCSVEAAVDRIILIWSKNGPPLSKVRPSRST
jgi:hypothetical protein